MSRYVLNTCLYATWLLYKPCCRLQYLIVLKFANLVCFQCGAMAQPGSPLTTHVLNTAMGVPGSGMTILLYKQDPSAAAWSLMTTG